MTKSTQLKTRYTITSADTDMFSRLKPGALVNYLIQSAISSAENLGFGFDDLKEEHLFWVLNRLSIEIYRPLMWNEQIEVETWPKNIERIFYIRDFIIRDAQGKIVAKASSAWLAIDLDTKHPGYFNKEKMEIFTALKDVNALEYTPEKLGGVKKQSETSITPTYFDIDLNKHVTSTRYVDWMMDTFSIDFHKNNYPKSLSINYIKETMIGETIVISNQADSNIHRFEGFNPAQNKIAFRTKVEF
ncbi:acyl-[acyl-carrier-protein] thioesterase [Carboxylicivirga sp. RSCT41]|uniref:acyl-[acyl-carrier-protein] thioesterase n=1 Tax=Carboxylicivirga agarovorans TaxID=3417570 RepID=UPI003D358967